MKKNKTFIKSLGRRARLKYFELKITMVSFGIRIYSDCMYVFRFYVLESIRGCHTEWTKSEGENLISYIKVYMWNLEKCCRWTYLQSRNGYLDIEDKLMNTKGEGRWDELGGWDWHIYTSIYKINK